MEDLELFVERVILLYKIREEGFPNVWGIELDKATFDAVGELSSISIGSLKFENYTPKREQKVYEYKKRGVEDRLKDRGIEVIAFFDNGDAVYFVNPDKKETISIPEIDRILTERREKKKEQAKAAPEGEKRAEDRYKDADITYLVQMHGYFSSLTEGERRGLLTDFPKGFSGDYTKAVAEYLKKEEPKNFLTAVLTGFLLLDIVKEDLKPIKNELNGSVEDRTSYLMEVSKAHAFTIALNDYMEREKSIGYTFASVEELYKKIAKELGREKTTFENGR